MSTVDDALKQTLDALRTQFSSELRELRADVKKLTESFRDVIRIEGDVKRQGDAVVRIGREVEDLQARVRDQEVRPDLSEMVARHERGIYELTRTSDRTRTRLSAADRIVWFLITAATNVGTAVIVYQVVH